MRRLFLAAWFSMAAVLLAAQDWDAPVPAGDAAAAEKYAEWAGAAISEGRWAAAEEALERAAGYADVSSDLSYLLALSRLHQGRPRGAVLEALRRAEGADRWNRYSPQDGLLLEAETLISLRLFNEAVSCLNKAEEDLQSLCLRLLAFRGLREHQAFVSTMTQAMNRFPGASQPVRILFQYAASRTPGAEDRELVNQVLRRLPLFLEEDPELSYLAVPFIRDTAEARRLVQAYRAAGGANPAALPAALNLGIIDEAALLEELFQETVIDLALILTANSLFRSDYHRGFLRERLSGFTGVITEDTDLDGRFETRARYQNGILREYSCDPDQDGLAELVIYCSATGTPLRAELAAYPDASSAPGPDRPFSYLVSDNERSKVFLEWETYPAVLQAELDGIKYMFRGREFFFSPVEFTEPVGSSLLFPVRDILPRVSRRTLLSFAYTVERPGREIRGTRELVELDRGIPQKSREYLGNKLVSETKFVLGLPLVQRIDLDLDGRLETARWFPSPLSRQDINFREDPLEYPRVFESLESDWDGDGIYEYGEIYEGDRIIRSWDMDKDGSREYTETVTDRHYVN